MKALILTLLPMVISLSSYASDKALIKTDSTCDNWNNLAVVIMQNRQAGWSLKTMLDFIPKYENELLNSASKHLVLQAYEKPLFSTDEYKKQATNEFANSVYLQCLKIKG